MGCSFSNFINRINVSVYNGETVKLLTYNDPYTLTKYINSYDIIKSFIDYNEQIIHKNEKEYEQALIILYKYSFNEEIKRIISLHIDTLNIESFYDFRNKLNNDEYINIIETNLLFDLNDLKAIKYIIMYLKNNDIMIETTYKKILKSYDYIINSFPNDIDYNVYH